MGRTAHATGAGAEGSSGGSEWHQPLFSFTHPSILMNCSVFAAGPPVRRRPSACRAPQKGLLLAALGGLLLVAGVAPALGQSDTRGLMLGLELGGASWSLEEEEAQGGGGLGLNVGYGLNHRVTLQAGLAGAYVTPPVGADYTLGHLDVGAQVHFRSPERSWRPYAQAFLTSVRADFGPNEYGPDARVSGGALMLGGGLKYFIRPRLALDADLRFSGGQITHVEAGDLGGDVELAMGSARFGLGLAWYPFR